jgi:heptaprenylglyceryl phosphate synthase
MDAGVDRAVGDVKIEPVFSGQVMIGARPAVGTVGDARQVQRTARLMALHAMSVEHVLHEPDKVEGA